MHIHQLEKGNEIRAAREYVKTMLTGISLVKTSARRIEIGQSTDGKPLRLHLDALPCLQPAYDTFLLLAHNALIQELGSLDDEFNLL